MEFSIYKPEDRRSLTVRFVPAQVAELADAVDSKSSGEILVGSIPTLGTSDFHCALQRSGIGKKTACFRCRRAAL
jgi:hypothetical protein